MLVYVPVVPFVVAAPDARIAYERFDTLDEAEATAGSWMPGDGAGGGFTDRTLDDFALRPAATGRIGFVRQNAVADLDRARRLL